MNGTILFENLAELSKAFPNWESLSRHAKGLKKLSDNKFLLNSCTYLLGSKSTLHEIESHQKILSIILLVDDGYKYIPDLQTDRSFEILKIAFLAHIEADPSTTLTVNFIESLFRQQNKHYHVKVISFLCDNALKIKPDVVFQLYGKASLNHLASALSESQLITAIDSAQSKFEISEKLCSSESTYELEMTL
ncbi:hypothetical protein OCF84_21235 (plasmid) [Shewanella xiamenensis]|uniref:Uncharacterized protein n=1 Tax=Shewanella xiamenensis TaxID=332186 RepID=A0ABT6UDQ1_9GAMM|nr:hypothetical protein [Shewanella xiamenensis]MDI5832599.1 hypothetical protein [Shewanella xiamenensis]WHF57783.1 hypothetical protein OCF84_21235 [Shewanella xiamenensis]